MVNLNKTVLIVNSDASVLRLFSSILIKTGYKVKTAQGGEEALEKVLKSSFDVIIINSWLPDTDLVDFLTKLSIVSKAVKIIITDPISIDLTTQKLDLGIYAYFSKMVKIPELLSLIEEKLKNKNS